MQEGGCDERKLQIELQATAATQHEVVVVGFENRDCGSPRDHRLSTAIMLKPVKINLDDVEVVPGSEQKLDPFAPEMS